MTKASEATGSPEIRELAGRSLGADAVRALGIIAIVVGHVVTTDWAYRITFTWHVPVFFFLSGAFWREDRDLADEWRSRVRSLVRPYVAWLCFISVVAIPMALSEGSHALVRRVGSMILGGAFLKTPYTAFWFFTCLFAASLMCRWARGRKVPWWALGTIGLAVTFVGPALKYLPLAIGTAIPCLVFIAAGRAYSCAPAFLRSPVAGAVTLAIGAAAVFTGVDRPFSIKNGDFGVPLLGVAVAIFICWGLLACLSRLRLGAPGRWLSGSVATYGSAVILAHGLPLDWFYGRANSLLVLAGVVLVTAVMLAIATRLPWRDALLGR